MANENRDEMVQRLNGLFDALIKWVAVHGPDFVTDEERALVKAFDAYMRAHVKNILDDPHVPQEVKLQVMERVAMGVLGVR